MGFNISLPDMQSVSTFMTNMIPSNFSNISSKPLELCTSFSEYVSKVLPDKSTLVPFLGTSILAVPMAVAAGIKSWKSGAKIMASINLGGAVALTAISVVALYNYCAKVTNPSFGGKQDPNIPFGPCLPEYKYPNQSLKLFA